MEVVIYDRSKIKQKRFLDLSWVVCYAPPPLPPPKLLLVHYSQGIQEGAEQRESVGNRSLVVQAACTSGEVRRR